MADRGLWQGDMQHDGGHREVGLPKHFCRQCLALTYRDDTRCIECWTERPPEGWDRLDHSGDPWLGTILQGRYVLTRRLGRGASSAVYRAESLKISRQFAVKVVDLSACDTEIDPALLRSRLRREVEAVGRLHNPHVVGFYELLELSRSNAAIVMDYIDGHTLDAVLRQEGRLAWPRACRLLRQLANAVHEAHEAGLVHRDLKPHNIMVERLSVGDEFAYVLDFGIVWMDDGMEVTQGFVGTPLYASPEQALGERLDRRSDIYSMGAIFYHMLTGRPPFESQSVIDVLKQHVRTTPAPLSEVVPQAGVPVVLEQLVEQMLAKSRAVRPMDLSEVIDVLDYITVSEAEVVEAPPDHLVGVSSDPSRAHLDGPCQPSEQTVEGLGVLQNSVVEQTEESAGGLGEESSSIYESRERDATGPKAAIFVPRGSRPRIST